MRRPRIAPPVTGCVSHHCVAAVQPQIGRRAEYPGVQIHRRGDAAGVEVVDEDARRARHPQHGVGDLGPAVLVQTTQYAYGAQGSAADFRKLRVIGNVETADVRFASRQRREVRGEIGLAPFAEGGVSVAAVAQVGPNGSPSTARTAQRLEKEITARQAGLVRIEPGDRAVLDGEEHRHRRNPVLETAPGKQCLAPQRLGCFRRREAPAQNVVQAAVALGLAAEEVVEGRLPRIVAIELERIVGERQDALRQPERELFRCLSERSFARFLADARPVDRGADDDHCENGRHAGDEARAEKSAPGGTVALPGVLPEGPVQVARRRAVITNQRPEERSTAQHPEKRARAVRDPPSGRRGSARGSKGRGKWQGDPVGS